MKIVCNTAAATHAAEQYNDKDYHYSDHCYGIYIVKYVRL